MKIILSVIVAAVIATSARCDSIDKAVQRFTSPSFKDTIRCPRCEFNGGARTKRAPPAPAAPKEDLPYQWLESMTPLLQFKEPVHERVDTRKKRAVKPKNEVNKKTVLPTLASQLERDPNLLTVSVNDDSPVTSYTVLNGDGLTYPTLPMVLRARIRPGHIRSYRDRPASNVCIPPPVVSNLELMGKRPGDHAGHLLAFTLGGPSEVYNFVPQLGRTNIGDYAREERIVRKFFKDNAKSDPWVDLLVVVVYSRVGRTMEKRPSGVSYYTMFYLGTRLVEQWFDILPNDAQPSIGPSNPTSTPGPNDLVPCGK